MLMEQTDLLILIGSLIFGGGALGSVAYYYARQARLKVMPPPAPVPEPALPEETVPPPRAELKVVKEPEPPSLNTALRSTRDSFWGKIQRSVLGSGSIDGVELETIEEILYTSDLGPSTVTRLLGSVESQLSRKEKRSLDTLKDSLKSEVQSILAAVPKMGHSPLEDFAQRPKPQIWMIVGVNGAGKTTTIGKLAHLAAQKGARVLVAAGDTFRAAAQSQLKVWSERAQVEIFSPEGVTDPGAVAFDAVQMAKARGYDLVLIDTAGRLHTQANLMDELKKVKRVIQKLDPQSPHETLIVLDANSGQNALVQAQKFNETLALTGAVFTKMDGTAKGGVVLGLASQLQIPTVFLGIGESMEALTGFNPGEYAEALFDAH
ncbi:MAG: signal recognition particle-docking protein FtsY [Bdellovibrionales bacterium]|nr:signal recognition particle-docking protein FtsY [Bdellovibrionales bacterium]